MLAAVQGSAEQGLNVWAAKHSGGQTDVVNHQEVYRGGWGPPVKIRRGGPPPKTLHPALGIDLHRLRLRAEVSMGHAAIRLALFPDGLGRRKAGSAVGAGD